jgi:hypothetical protein
MHLDILEVSVHGKILGCPSHHNLELRLKSELGGSTLLIMVPSLGTMHIIVAPSSGHVSATSPTTPTLDFNLGIMTYGAKTCYLGATGHGAELTVQRWTFNV